MGDGADGAARLEVVAVVVSADSSTAGSSSSAPEGLLPSCSLRASRRSGWFSASIPFI